MTGNPALAEIARQIHTSTPPQGMRSRIVAIDGLGGAGKSTLAAALASAVQAPVIATDDFASPDHPLDWDDSLMEQVLTPLAADRPAHYQRYDWHSKALGDWRTVPPGGIILLEGVSSSRARFRPFLSFGIWIDVPQSLRLERGLARDGADALAQWKVWQAEENDYVAREAPASRADLVLDGTLPVAL
ncbi:uridine kinase family protein [Flavimaricola marinus]|uniref:Uridine kinase n=1 Tax=Flavimaricola marinus TaxID=1819565 RepID=A0A238LFU1_9RHOB|nr:hypothetical protein [Flavimaricola marinus]SMY07826.1 hypothetical protein LOM8899_01966 [Flavimaricola marinus]